MLVEIVRTSIVTTVVLISDFHKITSFLFIVYVCFLHTKNGSVSIFIESFFLCKIIFYNFSQNVFILIILYGIGCVVYDIKP